MAKKKKKTITISFLISTSFVTWFWRSFHYDVDSITTQFIPGLSLWAGLTNQIQWNGLYGSFEQILMRLACFFLSLSWRGSQYFKSPYVVSLTLRGWPVCSTEYSKRDSIWPSRHKGVLTSALDIWSTDMGKPAAVWTPNLVERSAWRETRLPAPA